MATPHESGRSVIIVINKWDLVTTARTDDKPHADRKVYERAGARYLEVSGIRTDGFHLGIRGQGQSTACLKPFERVAAERRKRITTGQMNRFLEKVDFERATVPMNKRIRNLLHDPGRCRAADVHSLHQSGYRPALLLPAIPDPTRSALAFGFEGSPIWFKIKARNAEEKDK